MVIKINDLIRWCIKNQKESKNTVQIKDSLNKEVIINNSEQILFLQLGTEQTYKPYINLDGLVFMK